MTKPKKPSPKRPMDRRQADKLAKEIAGPLVRAMEIGADKIIERRTSQGIGFRLLSPRGTWESAIRSLRQFTGIKSQGKTHGKRRSSKPATTKKSPRS